MSAMITREKLIDAVGRLVADLSDGTWGLSDDCVHPAIVALYDELPAAPEPGTTRPLTAVVPAHGFDAGYVGYRIPIGPDGRLATIAGVEQLGPRGRHSFVARLTFVEYPGYHIDVTTSYVVYADAAIADPPKVDAHPNLIDRSHDTWRWYEGYGMNDPGLWDRAEIESEFGPVRDA